MERAVKYGAGCPGKKVQNVGLCNREGLFPM